MCDKSFAQLSELNRHKRSHEVQMQQSIMSQSILSSSINTITPEKPFRCEICNASFTVKASLIGHMRGHNGIKPYQCTQCGKRFTNKSSHSAHLKVHLQGEKCFKCDICNRKVKNKIKKVKN